MKFASVNFSRNVKLPNIGQVSGVTAAGNLQETNGFSLDYDEEYGYLRVTAKKPRTAKDTPRCVFRENIVDFEILEDHSVEKKAK